MLSQADLEYVRTNFVTLEELCTDCGRDADKARSETEAGRLPGASYTLDDGTEMVPADLFRLAEEAHGFEHVREEFLTRYRRAAEHELGTTADAEAEWEAYLSGEYGVCLKQVTPETIVRKTALIARIESCFADPRPDELRWRDELFSAVEELDELERPFAPHYDRIRFGGPSSRERLIDQARERYPEVFAAPIES